MSLLPSGNKYRDRAEADLENAKAIEDAQSNVEFGRNLLANIRQERIARAQLELGNTSADYSSSSAAGAVANIDSSLAGEMRYSYETSHRAQKVVDLQESAQKNMKKYASKSQLRATVSSAVGTAVGATAGFLVGGPPGAIAGAQIGQGIGQIAADTGTQNTMQGIQNIISGASTGYEMNQFDGLLKTMDISKGLSKYEVSSVNPQTNQIIPGSTINAGSYYSLMKLGRIGLRP